MERKLGIAIIAAAVAFAVVRFGAGAVAFKPGIEVEILHANANTYAWITAAIVAGLSLVLSTDKPAYEDDE